MAKRIDGMDGKIDPKMTQLWFQWHSVKFTEAIPHNMTRKHPLHQNGMLCYLIAACQIIERYHIGLHRLHYTGKRKRDILVSPFTPLLSPTGHNI